MALDVPLPPVKPSSTRRQDSGDEAQQDEHLAGAKEGNPRGSAEGPLVVWGFVVTETLSDDEAGDRDDR
jgi:hypothetical protein